MGGREGGIARKEEGGKGLLTMVETLIILTLG